MTDGAARGSSVRWDNLNGASFDPVAARRESRVTVTVHDAGMPETLYLFLDESGNFDFKQGTNYFFMTCIATRRPFLMSEPLNELRHDMLESGLDIERFHASEDSNDVKGRVFGCIKTRLETIAAYSIYIDKRLVPEDGRDPATLYSKAFGMLLDEVLSVELADGTKRVVIITDSLPKEAKRRNVVKPLKGYMAKVVVERGVSYILCHHASSSNAYLQVADYVSWAINRSFVRGEHWSLDAIRPCVREIGRVSFEGKG